MIRGERSEGRRVALPASSHTPGVTLPDAHTAVAPTPSVEDFFQVDLLQALALELRAFAQAREKPSRDAVLGLLTEQIRKYALDPVTQGAALGVVLACEPTLFAGLAPRFPEALLPSASAHAWLGSSKIDQPFSFPDTLVETLAHAQSTEQSALLRRAFAELPFHTVFMASRQVAPPLSGDEAVGEAMVKAAPDYDPLVQQQVLMLLGEMDASSRDAVLGPLIVQPGTFLHALENHLEAKPPFSALRAAVKKLPEEPRGWQLTALLAGAARGLGWNDRRPIVDDWLRRGWTRTLPDLLRVCPGGVPTGDLAWEILEAAGPIQKWDSPLDRVDYQMRELRGPPEQRFLNQLQKELLLELWDRLSDEPQRQRFLDRLQREYQEAVREIAQARPDELRNNFLVLSSLQTVGCAPRVWSSLLHLGFRPVTGPMWKNLTLDQLRAQRERAIEAIPADAFWERELLLQCAEQVARVLEKRDAATLGASTTTTG